MASDPRQTRGVQIVATPGARAVRWLLVAALAVLAVAAHLIVRLAGRERADVGAATVKAPPRPPPAASPRPAPTPSVAVATRDTDAPPGAKGDAPAGHVRRRRIYPPKPATDIPGLPKPGETTGIAVFPPPGTKPIKQGIIVPDDFVLPEGYVRHYQTTDDGRRLPPVLMFHPDYEGVDANGNPVPLPEDGLVPPEMAPPGMPIRKLELPDKTAGTSDRAR